MARNSRYSGVSFISGGRFSKATMSLSKMKIVQGFAPPGRGLAAKICLRAEDLQLKRRAFVVQAAGMKMRNGNRKWEVSRRKKQKMESSDSGKNFC
jgi:hypothetical protein